jgi:hypothetical protein
MKKIIFVLSVVFLFSFNSLKGQTTSCSQLIEYVYKNGTNKGTIDNSLFLTSEWLKKTEAFSIDNSIVVIAEFYTNKSHSSSQRYVFCDVPSSNWNTFYNNRRLVLAKSSGEQFHEYIYDYKCNCN